MVSCFLFGHSNTPDTVLPQLEKAMYCHYCQHGVRRFYFGNRGRFDRLALTAGKRFQSRFPDVELCLVLSYHPAERQTDDAGFDCSYFPPIDAVPHPFRIVQTNKYMIDFCNTIICYANQVGNAKKMLEYAVSQQKKRQLPISNLAPKV